MTFSSRLSRPVLSGIRAAFAAFVITGWTLAPIGPAQAVEHTTLSSFPGFNLGWTHVV